MRLRPCVPVLSILRPVQNDAAFKRFHSAKKTKTKEEEEEGKKTKKIEVKVQEKEKEKRKKQAVGRG